MGYEKKKLDARSNGGKKKHGRLGIGAAYPAMGNAMARADWKQCDSAAIGDLVAYVADLGGAVLLGYSRDGGAYRVVIFDEDDQLKKWVPCTTDITEAMWNLLVEVQELAQKAALDGPEAD